MREGAGKPSVHLLNDWLVVGQRVYGRLGDGRYINAPLENHSGIAKQGQHLAGKDNATFVLGNPLGRID